MQAVISEKLAAALDPAELHVTTIDEASGKFEVYVVSSAFEGKGLLARHRMINDIMKPELENNAVHALSIKGTRTPAEVAPKS